MKKLVLSSLILLFSLAVLPHPSQAAELAVTVYKDSLEEGTLPVVLHHACHTPGDDIIRFVPPLTGAIEVPLKLPLVVPRDCDGKVTIIGDEERDTIIKSLPIPGGGAEGSSCSLVVYSNQNRIDNLSFLGNSLGAAVCLFGNENRVTRSRFGRDLSGMLGPNRYGVVISNYFASKSPGVEGRDNQVLENTFAPGSLHAIFAKGEGSVVGQNRIETPFEMGIVQLLPRSRISSNTLVSPGQIGIFLQGNEHSVVANRIMGSKMSGIRHEGAGSRLERNEIEGAGEDGILHIGDKTRFIGNVVVKPAGVGILLKGEDLIVDSNEIAKSLSFGIRYDGARSTISQNRIENSGNDGILYSGSNSIFVKNTVIRSKGTGISLRGDGLTVYKNEVVESGGDGIVSLGGTAQIDENKIVLSFRNGLRVEGDDLILLENDIQSNAWAGISIRSKNSRLARNRILGNGGCPREERLSSHRLNCLDGKGSGGPGILIERGSEGILVGGPSFDLDRNIVQYNRDGGVVILGDKTSVRHKITHNTISKNYGSEPDLDLGGDGLNENDLEDPDEGPNHLLNFVDWFQAFPLVPSPTGGARYWTWGLVRSSPFVNTVEMYGVPSEDVLRKRVHGGGETFFGESSVDAKTFRIPPHSSFNSFEDTMLTMLSFSNKGDTSEFAVNTRVGRDKDLDGIIDSLETGDGTPPSGGTATDRPDSDGDGLPDPVEDRDRNGKWDKDRGETCAYNTDSDGDGLSDWIETHGDGIYDPGFDTDPLNSDTDGDGIDDGIEDKNRDGIWQAYAGETSPLSTDSDNDGVVDGKDICPVVFNPGGEPWFCGK